MPRAGSILRFLRSTSVRLSLRFAALYAVVTAIIFALTYVLADREVTQWVAQQLENDAAGFAELYDAEGPDATLRKLNGYAGFSFEDYRIYFLEAPDGTVLSGNVAGMDWSGDSGYVPLDRVHALHPRDDDVAGYLLHSVMLGPNRLTLGTSTYFLEELREVLEHGLMAGFILLMLVGVVAGIIVGRKTERRLTEIAGTLQSVAMGRLDARIPPLGREADDLARVAEEINRTIIQLQHMVEAQKQISADIAHDLRTPMQGLRQRLEGMTQSHEMSPRLQAEISDATRLVDELIDTFHALLRIAQIESGQRRERFTDVPLAPLLARIEDAYSPVAEENGQQLVFALDGDTSVQGDQQLLTQMFANVVENALRHAPAGALIRVSLRQQDRAVVEIADNGPGIPVAEREKVLRRFYRLEKSRTTPGNGLGLSLVKAIADLHGAELVLSDNQPGLRVTVRF